MAARLNGLHDKLAYRQMIQQWNEKGQGNRNGRWMWWSINETMKIDVGEAQKSGRSLSEIRQSYLHLNNNLKFLDDFEKTVEIPRGLEIFDEACMKKNPTKKLT